MHVLSAHLDELLDHISRPGDPLITELEENEIYLDRRDLERLSKRPAARRPQNKSWQKELKATWDALCEGKYDWAHLAMHLWPERVVPKCAQDRSLAIAHGLEDVFWIEGGDGKWTARKTPTRSVDDLVKERTSPAVKSALKSLLEQRRVVLRKRPYVRQGEVGNWLASEAFDLKQPRSIEGEQAVNAAEALMQAKSPLVPASTGYRSKK